MYLRQGKAALRRIALLDQAAPLQPRSATLHALRAEVALAEHQNAAALDEFENAQALGELSEAQRGSTANALS